LVRGDPDVVAALPTDTAAAAGTTRRAGLAILNARRVIGQPFRYISWSMVVAPHEIGDLGTGAASLSLWPAPDWFPATSQATLREGASPIEENARLVVRQGAERSSC
jgi:hypothetical protein